ncbi:hypothetical protein ACP6EW_18610 [Hafnia paralvei]|uniref:hypothetical protein n=1 Tax=Hafnia paralvei TaxID=546367 RepID=UPI003CF371D4
MISSLIDAVEIITDPGISIEIKESFRDEPEVLNFNLVVKERKYFVKVKMKDFSYQVSKELFMSMVIFIQYPCFTYYKRNIRKNKIVYELITADEDMKGFVCEITFE